ncbi:MAG: tripartite tricarboxylate transporter substrate binding protein [Xanthobacteraceae bacterium]
MRSRAIRTATMAMILAMAIGAATGAAAQGYPDRVAQIIAPATAGSSADILGRVLAEGFSARLGKPFIIVNKPGANGVLGTADVARANADGYTLLHTATYSITVQPLTNKEVGYTSKSFTPICQTFKNDQVVVVPPNSPLKTAHDLIAAAQKKPGAMTVGIPGIATIPHLAMIQLADEAKVKFNDVPFKGPAEEIQNVRSGQIDFAAVPLTAAAGSGLPMPGLFAETRNPSLPNVPTFKEQGYDVAPLSFGGLLGPAGMPSDVTHKLEAACIAIMQSDAAQRVVKNTLQPADYFADSAGFAKNIAEDVAEKIRLVAMLKPN